MIIAQDNQNGCTKQATEPIHKQPIINDIRNVANDAAQRLPQEPCP